MCGLIGLLSARREAVVRGLQAGTAAIAHRGPDDEGADVLAFGPDWLGLGHRRLSILDLSASGRQPMTHPPTGCRIVFNGEIYNYRRLRVELEAAGEAFQGGSDTEVLLAGLARYGDAYLGRLEGMYAFAFFDPRSTSLLLGRDPAGIKPLYVYESDRTLAFASEVRALLATGLVPPQIDRGAVAAFLAYGAVQHPATLIQCVRSVPPGSVLAIRDDGAGMRAVTSAAFWRLPAASEAGDAVATVRGTFDAAVSDHLVADVPVGLFLSSGLDSTIIAGLASGYTPRLRSFTVTFEDRPDFSEQRLAAETARLFGLVHTEIALPESAAEAAVGDWLAAADSPSIDGLNVFVISRAVREHGIKVALSGLGADELFGGYGSFREVPRLHRISRLTRPLPRGLKRGAADIAAIGRPPAVREKLRDLLAGDTLRSTCLRRRRVMSDGQMSQLGMRSSELGLDREFLPPGATWDVEADGPDAVRIVSQVEFRCYQGNMLLRDADVDGMASGLEIRVPFLDRRMLDLALALPGRVRLPPGGQGKHLLRLAFADLLRPEVASQAKRGFALPIGSWMAGSLKPVCEQALRTLKGLKLLHPAGVDSVWEAFLREPNSPMWSRAFALVVLGDFCRKTGAVA